PAQLSAVLMLFGHVLLHFPVPSTSGQALMTMPILVPLSDLIGISRQVCVLAYQYGAGLPDILSPTNGALVAILAIAGIRYDQWLSFIWRPFLLVITIGAIAIVIGVLTGYS
ncbi:MAG: YfcC family protein, partial [Cyclobacteriaceae bacterium]